jgi:hypothetical protein
LEFKIFLKKNLPYRRAETSGLFVCLWVCLFVLLPILVELDKKKQLSASSELTGPLAQTVLLPDGFLWNFVLAQHSHLYRQSTALRQNNGHFIGGLADVPVTGPHKER